MTKNDKNAKIIDEMLIINNFVIKVLQKKEATTYVIASFSVFYGFLHSNINGQGVNYTHSLIILTSWFPFWA